MLLESMKKGVSKILIQVLAVLLIISFAAWGVGDMVGVIATPDEVATVDGEKISQREYQEQFRRAMNRLRSRMGDIDAQQARTLGVARSTLEGMISRRLLGKEAGGLGLLVGDEQVVRRIHAQPGFQNALGRFDRAAFQSALANSGFTEASYVETLRRELQEEYLSGALREGVRAPPQLADIIFRHSRERRTAEVIRVERPARSPTPSERDLAAYLEENPEPFMAPEYRSLTLLYLDPEKVAGEMSPAPERVREEYDNRIDSITVPEKRRLEQILFKSEENARKAYAALSEGRAFEAVAAEFPERPATDLGLVAETDLTPEIADAAFALSADGFAEPVETPFGWHLVKVREIEPGRTPTFAETEAEIRGELALELALDDIVKRANRVEDAFAGGAGVEEAAAEIGASLRRLESVDPALTSRAGTEIEGLPEDARFVATAFDTNKGETSDLVGTDAGGFFVLRVDDVAEPAMRPLDEVRDAVTAAWRRSHLDHLARGTAEEIAKEAEAGRSLAGIAETRDLEVEKIGPVDRAGTDAEFPPALLSRLFETPRGAVFHGPTESGSAVVRVLDIETAEPDRSDDDYKSLEEDLTGAMFADLLEEYVRALRRERDVVVNQAALDAFFAGRR